MGNRTGKPRSLRRGGTYYYWSPARLSRLNFLTRTARLTYTELARVYDLSVGQIAGVISRYITLTPEEVKERQVANGRDRAGLPTRRDLWTETRLTKKWKPRKVKKKPKVLTSNRSRANSLNAHKGWEKRRNG